MNDYNLKGRRNTTWRKIAEKKHKWSSMRFVILFENLSESISGKKAPNWMKFLHNQ